MALAMTSLPVPVSPSMRTVESVGATVRTRSSVSIRAVLHPTIPSNSCCFERFSLARVTLPKLCASGKAICGLPILHPPTPSLHLADCVGLGGLRDQTAATVIASHANCFGIRTMSLASRFHSPDDDSGRSVPIESTGRTRALTRTLNAKPLHPVNQGRPLQSELCSRAL